MSEPFITQLDTELPLVVVIYDQSPFSEVICKILEKTNFTLEFLSSKKIDGHHLQKLFFSPTLFRVILVSESPSLISKWWGNLLRVNPSLPQGYGITPVEVWDRKIKFASPLSLLQIQDILSPTLFPWKNSISPAKSSLTQYRGDLFPLNQDEVRRAVLSFIAHPHPTPLQIVQGTAISGATLAHHLLRLVSAKNASSWTVHTKDLVRPEKNALPPIEIHSPLSAADVADLIISWQDLTVPEEMSAVSTLPEPKIKVLKPQAVSQVVPFQQVEAFHYPKTVQIPTLKPPVIKKQASPSDAPTVKTEKKTAVKTAQKKEVSIELRSAQELDDMLQKLFLEERVQQKGDVVKEMASSTLKTKKKNKYKRRLYGLSLFLFVGLLLISGFAAFSVSSFLQVKAATQQARSHNGIATQWLYQINAPLQNIIKTVPVPGITTSLETAGFLVSYQGQLSHNTQTHEQAGAFLQQVFGNHGGDIFPTWNTLSQKITTDYQQFSLLQAQLKNNTLEADLEKWSTLQQSLDAQRRSLAAITQLQPFVPALLAEDGKRSYAVLLVDSAELRPLGGKIVAVGFIDLADGKVVNTRVTSAAAIEAQFPGTLSAPQLIQSMFSRQNWSFSDTLWEPSLQESSQSVIGILQTSQQEPIAGLMVLPLESLGKISGKEQLSSEILSKVAQDPTVALNQTVYSTALESFLTSLSTLSPIQLVTVAGTTMRLLQQQEAAVFLANPSEESVMESLGWAGSLLSPACPPQFNQDKCIVDPFFQIEANVGDNKTNALLQRTMTHAIDISRQGAHHTRQITLRNAATSTAWPYGTYHAQMQLFLAPEAALEAITINGTAVPAESIVQATHDGRRELLFPVSLPARQTATIVITYQHSFNEEGKFSYAFFDQKQLGMDADPLTITVSYSDDLRPTLIAPQAEVQSHLVSFSAPRTTHSFVGIRFE